MKKSTSIVLLATILLQSCVAYQKTSVSLEEAANKGNVKLIGTDGNVYEMRNIEMQDSIYYGFIGKEKTLIAEASLAEIYLQDKKKSTRWTVLGITIPIVVLLVVFIVVLSNASGGSICICINGSDCNLNPC